MVYILARLLNFHFTIFVISTFSYMFVIERYIPFVFYITVSCRESRRKALVRKEQAYISCFKMGGIIAL